MATGGTAKTMEKKQWGRKIEFLLSLAGYSVGLGNLWRFPYLCRRNGGGAFLIPFFIFLMTCGLPLFFLECVIGQFSGRGSQQVWNVAPLFAGVGLAMNLVCGMCALYYNIIIAWALYYFGHVFTSRLPWMSCDNDWNSDNCYTDSDCLAYRGNASAIEELDSISSNSTLYNASTLGNSTLHDMVRKCSKNSTAVSAAEEFWRGSVLRMSGGLHDMGYIQWEMMICFFAAWLFIFLCLIKGVESLGKVVYVTATLPYFLLTAILIRGLTLPGAGEGIIYYLTPNFSQLLRPQVWIEAGVQVFYSLGPAWGSLIIMASHNKFQNNCLKDSVFITFLGEGTSIYGGLAVFSVLGYMAKMRNTGVEDVVTSGPGLGFIVYPEALSMLPLPQLWAALFFLMLIAVGVDTQFAMVEVMCSSVLESFPKFWHRRRALLTGLICGTFFLLGLPLTMNGGIYVFQLFDWYSTSFGLPLIGVMECVVLGWIYGTDRLADDVFTMMGRRPPAFMTICWKFITPGILAVALGFAFYAYVPPKYGDYEFPEMARAVGWCIGLLPIVPIPCVMIYKLIVSTGTFKERLQSQLKPSEFWERSCKEDVLMDEQEEKL
ncbi:sodium- and chloride-dependent glycine transporter 2-like [Babylonia areolata]|uniref:sodium- and chloride-dependent glycine transporter 2-like n=1 Tax=Babylonia areolata TaxID=304850 RepID=UPI003FD099BA